MFLNDAIYPNVLTFQGSIFPRGGAATEKAQFPILVLTLG